ncbi:GNAT family N-acetyltransferase [Thermococcus aggregans]|uniref:GNAT family N-acetyltransferase n=1 Tax=Thermococcus aggregans TaxID=110163 RepID=A0A9E7MZ73_THEAG|nr:GNAT family N-acetyltransferase [Thermococcus aggregans]USS41714.1 GNAT family N-acetyltransferase [Thermococcus aggregans]
MSNEIKIEKLKKLDQETLETLVGIYMRGYENLREYGGEGESYAKRYIRWCWSKASDGFFVAKDEDRIVGFIVCDNDWHSRYENRVVGAIHEFVIDKDYQGKSVGKKLMEKALEYLSKYNDKIELWVGEKNTKAIEFYKKYGFKVAGKSGIWVRMVKDLKEEK